MCCKFVLVFVVCMSGFIALSNAIVKISLTVGDNLNFYFPKSCMPIEVIFNGDQLAVISEMGSEFRNAEANSVDFDGFYNSTHVRLSIMQVTNAYAGVYIVVPSISSSGPRCPLFDSVQEYSVTITEANTVEPSTATVSTSTPSVLATQPQNTTLEQPGTVTATVVVPKTTSTELTTDPNVSSTEGHTTVPGATELYLPIVIAVGVTLFVTMGVGVLVFICIKHRQSNSQKADTENTGNAHRGVETTTKKDFGRKQNTTESKQVDELKVDEDEYHIYAEPDDDIDQNVLYQDNNTYIHPTYSQSNNNAAYGYYSEPQSEYDEPIKTKVRSGYLEFSGIDNAKQTVQNNVYTIPEPASDNSVGYTPLAFQTPKENTIHNAKITQNNVYTTPGPNTDNNVGYTPLNFDTFKGKAMYQNDKYN